jgi:hypothetical protein
MTASKIDDYYNYKITKDIMKQCLESSKSKKKSWFKSGRKITVDNKMQKNYEYELTYKAGTKLSSGGLDPDGNTIKYPEFTPEYNPGQILRMGAFEGKYCNDQIYEFPREWYKLSKLSPEKADITINHFGIKSRQSLQEWKRKKWVPCHPLDPDTRGWFEWYCRYWIGRRIPEVDPIQIKRWRSFKRHYGQFTKNTKGKGNHIHPRRRQALLQWSYPCLD